MLYVFVAKECKTLLSPDWLTSKALWLIPSLHSLHNSLGSVAGISAFAQLDMQPNGGLCSHCSATPLLLLFGAAPQCKCQNQLVVT